MSANIEMREQDIVMVEDEKEVDKIAKEKNGLIIHAEIIQTEDGDYMLTMYAFSRDELTDEVFLHDVTSNIYLIRDISNTFSYISPKGLMPVSYFKKKFDTFEEAVQYAKEAVSKIKELREKVRKKYYESRKIFKSYFVI